MTYIEQAARAIARADALLLGASNGLSIAEGYHIFACNDMFRHQFGSYHERYGIRNVIEGCFFAYPSESERTDFMQRLVQLWIDEYRPSKVMKNLRHIVGDKDHFVITSNADTHLELSGFDADRVFEVEGTFDDMLHRRAPQDKSRQANGFIARHHGEHIVIIELGIGSRNTLIKRPLMQLAASEPHATYITLNLPQELYIPQSIAHKSIGLAGDIATTLSQLRQAIDSHG